MPTMSNITGIAHPHVAAGLTLVQIRNLPGVKDLSVKVAGKFAQALRAKTYLVEAVAAESAA